jgi:flagellar basal-body rod protein FlgB
MSDSFSIGRNNAIQNLERALDGAALRQKLITNNLANVDTPGYKRSDVSFQEQLARSMSGGHAIPLAITDPAHQRTSGSGPTLPFTVMQDTSSTYRNDGNNVDIEREMVESTKNNIYYNTATQLLSGKFGTLRYVIEEGR